MDHYTRENAAALVEFHCRGHEEFNGVDGRTLHALANRGLVWFEKRGRGYIGGLTSKGLAMFAEIEGGAEA